MQAHTAGFVYSGFPFLDCGDPGGELRWSAIIRVRWLASGIDDGHIYPCRIFLISAGIVILASLAMCNKIPSRWVAMLCDVR
jgi:hypothetical protein